MDIWQMLARLAFSLSENLNEINEWFLQLMVFRREVSIFGHFISIFLKSYF